MEDEDERAAAVGSLGVRMWLRGLSENATGALGRHDIDALKTIIAEAYADGQTRGLTTAQ